MSAPSQDETNDLVARFYRDYYSQVFSGSGIVGRGYRRTHELVEKGFAESPGDCILEIGAGQAEHLNYVSPNFSTYTMVDLLEPPEDLLPRLNGRLRWIASDITDCEFPPASFDRIISMCVLHHLQDLTGSLERIRTWMAPGGTFSLFLPSDPGMLNRINRRLFVSRRSRRLGFGQYELVNSREHRNHYWSIRTELRFQFRDCRIKTRYWPIGVPLADASLFSIWQIQSPPG